MSTVGNKRTVVLIRRQLKKLIVDSQTLRPNGRMTERHLSVLRGQNRDVNPAVSKAQRYLAVIAVERPEPRDIPEELNQNVIPQLRRTATNTKLDARLRIQAIETQLRITGFSCGVHHRDEVDALIDEALGLTAPVETPLGSKPRSLKREEWRGHNRGKALKEIRRNFLQDLSEGRFFGLQPDQFAKLFRLDDMPARDIPPERNEEFLRKQRREKFESQLRRKTENKGETQ